MNQVAICEDLFSWRPAPCVNTPTSKEAARSIERHRSRLCLEIYQFIVEHAGATCDECEVALGLSHQTASARIRDLAKVGELIDSGEIRKTRSGRSAIIWKPA